MKPAAMVERYAIKTVMKSILPALVPMSAIAGVTSPTIIRGMANPRNWLNMPLKVMNIRAIQSGAANPDPIPSAIADRIFQSRLIFSLFMLLRLAK